MLRDEAEDNKLISPICKCFTLYISSSNNNQINKINI